MADEKQPEPLHSGLGMTGDNKPPEAQMLRDELLEKYDPLLKKRTAELTNQLNALPDPLPDDLLEQASELLKATSTQLQKIDGMRKVEKEPFLEGGRVVDGYFNGMADALEAARKRAKPVYETAHDLRGEAERRRQEDEARKRREAADAQRRAAEEQERLKRAEAERLQREAEDAERKRQEEAERLKRDQSLEAEKAQRLAAQEAERLKREAERQAADAADAARVAARATSRAEVAEVNQQRIETAKPSEFARIRTDRGVVASQREEFDFLVTDYDKIPKVFLWKYIAKEALNSAIKAAIEAGVRDIKGVRIFPKRTSLIR